MSKIEQATARHLRILIQGIMVADKDPNHLIPSQLYEDAKKAEKFLNRSTD